VKAVDLSAKTLKVFIENIDGCVVALTRWWADSFT
jgi:hypothetical protein